MGCLGVPASALRGRRAAHVVFWHADLAQDRLDHRVVEPRIELVARLLPASDAEHAADVLLDRTRGVDARRFERFLDFEQREGLVCVGILHLQHVEVELARLEREVRDETTARAVDLVFLCDCGRIVCRHVHAIVWQIAYVVNASLDHLPGLVHILPTGEDARVSHNCHLLVLQRLTLSAHVARSLAGAFGFELLLQRTEHLLLYGRPSHDRRQRPAVGPGTNRPRGPGTRLGSLSTPSSSSIVEIDGGRGSKCTFAGTFLHQKRIEQGLTKVFLHRWLGASGSG